MRVAGETDVEPFLRNKSTYELCAHQTCHIAGTCAFSLASHLNSRKTGSHVYRPVEELMKKYDKYFISREDFINRLTAANIKPKLQITHKTQLLAKLQGFEEPESFASGSMSNSQMEVSASLYEYDDNLRAANEDEVAESDHVQGQCQVPDAHSDGEDNVPYKPSQPNTLEPRSYDDCNVGNVLKCVEAITNSKLMGGKEWDSNFLDVADELHKTLQDYSNAVKLRSVAQHNNDKVSHQLANFLQLHKKHTSDVIRYKGCGHVTVVIRLTTVTHAIVAFLHFHIYYAMSCRLLHLTKLLIICTMYMSVCIVTPVSWSVAYQTGDVEVCTSHEHGGKGRKSCSPPQVVYIG
jgi:hypothetical protein